MSIKWWLVCGVICIAGATITADAVATRPADATLPPGTNLNWDKANVIQLNAKRAQVPLDGIWHFVPATEGSDVPPKLGCDSSSQVLPSRPHH